MLLAPMFLMAGFGKVMQPDFYIGYMKAYIPLSNTLILIGFVGAATVLLAGGLSVLLGFKARWGAFALILFLIPTTLIFHTKFSDPIQMMMFLKNLGLMGGMLMVTAYGPGPISIDYQLEKKGAGKSGPSRLDEGLRPKA